MLEMSGSACDVVDMRAGRSKSDRGPRFLSGSLAQSGDESALPALLEWTEYGKQHGFQKLTRAEWKATDQDAWDQKNSDGVQVRGPDPIRRRRRLLRSR